MSTELGPLGLQRKHYTHAILQIKLFLTFSFENPLSHKATDSSEIGLIVGRLLWFKENLKIAFSYEYETPRRLIAQYLASSRKALLP